VDKYLDKLLYICYYGTLRITMFFTIKKEKGASYE